MRTKIQFSLRRNNQDEPRAGMTFLMVKEPRKGGGEKSGLYESCPGQGPFLEIPVTFPAQKQIFKYKSKEYKRRS